MYSQLTECNVTRPFVDGDVERNSKTKGPTWQQTTHLEADLVLYHLPLQYSPHCNQKAWLSEYSLVAYSSDTSDVPVSTGFVQFTLSFVIPFRG